LLFVAPFVLTSTSSADDITISNHHFSVAVRNQDGAYEIRANQRETPVLRSLVGAQINHRWIKSNEYPTHRTARSEFQDALGRGEQITVTFGGLAGRPNISYSLQLYNELPFGSIQVQVNNRTSKAVTAQAIRSLEAIGDPLVDLGAGESSERVLSDTFSEAHVQVYDLGQVPEGMHLAVGSQLIYNRESQQSLFLGALSSNRFVTMLRFQVGNLATGGKAKSYTVDSTGTTEARSQAIWFRQQPAENRIELSLPIVSGATLSSERLMFALGNDYHSQLESYGAAIRELHHARVTSENLMGWWSWTSYYMAINDGNAYTNAQWMAQHLKPSGYNFLHIDEGYQYARGEYMTPDATKFPHGMGRLTAQISQLGLNLGLWVAPLEVSERAWIVTAHKDWLVRNRQGRPLRFNPSRDEDPFFVLDATHPGVREYLRQTFQTLVKRWGARYIKLDFMDRTAAEGYYYRPHTTALEAQRIALQTIREAVGEDVLLDKDGSPMLNPVGIVDEGRISGDTKHQYPAWKERAPGILARYYMHRNFFVNDPDAFTLQREGPRNQIKDENTAEAPLTLSEAEISISLAALSGGMFEIGDDLPSLASEPDRMALLTNPDLLQMEKLGRAAKPVDLLEYSPDDLQPSIAFLREDDRQSVLAVFNWTEGPRSHAFKLAQLGLPEGHAYRSYDVFKQDQQLSVDGDTVLIADQAPHSVKLIKIVDESISPGLPTTTVDAPKIAKAGEPIIFAANSDPTGVPALGYHWDFGDGVTAEGARLTHTYTAPGNYTVKLMVDGLDGVSAQKTLSMLVDGTVIFGRPVRYVEEISRRQPNGDSLQQGGGK
jgi:hypothetical protein